MRAPTRFAVTAATAALIVTLAACSSDDGVATGRGPGDVATVAPATPADSPPQSAAPVGSVLAGPGGSAVAHSGSRVAVLSTEGALTLYTAPGAMDTPPPTPVALSGVTALTADGDGFLASSPQQVARIGADGTVTEIAGAQGPVISVAATAEKILLGTSDGHLRVLDRDGELTRDIHEFVRVDQILVAPDGSAVAGQVIVIDRAQSMVAPVDIATGDRKASLRAGNGAAVGVFDSYGRLLVTNTPDDQLLGFFGEPIIMRFRYPVAASPYALTWDDNRKLLWVSTSADNQAVAYDLSTGEPRERARIATVGQVSAMTTDPANGMLYLISERGDGLQVVPRVLVDIPE